MATRYLSSSPADGWNVVTGALLLARVWAIRETTTTAPCLDRQTRLRLATCLSVSWKFQRSMFTIFPRLFGHSGEVDGIIPPSLLTGVDTLELAHLAIGFLYDTEKAHLAFETKNATEIRRLYKTMVNLEVNLLRSVAVFGILTDNAQVGTEYVAEDYVVSKTLTAERALLVRSMVPFFVRSSVCGLAGGRNDDLFVELMDPLDKPHKGAEHSALALFAAAYFAVCAGTSSRPTLTFSETELTLAKTLIDAALHGRDSDYLFGQLKTSVFASTRSLLTAQRSITKVLDTL